MHDADIFYFNPTCELAVANGSFSYMPPRLLHKFELDCSILPFLFSLPGDFVITEEKPSLKFIAKMKDAGFEMPEFRTLNELLSLKNEIFGSIIPWGWSPAAHFTLKDLKAKCSPEIQNNISFSWSDEHKMLYERKTSLDFLLDFLKQNQFDFFIEKEMTGTIITEIEEVENILEKRSPLVLKAPLSSSGRGIQIIRKTSLNISNRQWISGILKQQKYLIAEPYLDKIADISFQFSMIENNEPEYLGFSVFETNSNGQYKSSLIHPEIGNSSFAEIFPEMSETIKIVALRLKEALNHSVYKVYHQGYLGIDTLIYKDKQEIKIQPCVEINNRMNMGILTLNIEKKICEDSTGKFELFYGSRGEFQKYALEKALELPIEIKNGKLSSGFLSLVEPDEDKLFGAYIILKPVRN